jgi:stage II sporulation protein D
MNRLFPVAGLLLVAACATTPQSASPAAQPQSQTQSQSQPAPHSVNALTPIAAPAKSITEPRIRVGMLTDQATVKFPRIDGGYVLVADSGASTLRRGFTAEAPLRNTPARYAVQVASLSDKTSVDAFVERIRTETGQRVDTTFDPSTANGGMYRILVGDFPDSQSANPLRDDLTKRGYGKDMLVVRRPSDQPFARQVEITDDEGDHDTITTASLLILPATGDTISIGDKPYRTAARLFINPRGTFNVINELNLEDYLRGVVPAEMGPKVYDELEALKAQAIAARTYAVRNMNGFRAEGFDICPGPACQAYLGFSGEEALSNEAVKETAGLVMTYDGKPIDALFTSTCGGETSDVSTMFPNRNEPYLKRARCVEMEMTSIAGRADSGILSEMQLNARVFAAMAGLRDNATFTEAIRAAAVATGFNAPAAGLASARRGDVLRYLAHVFALERNARTLTLPEDRQYLFPQTANAETDAAYQAATFLVKYGVWPAQEIDKVDLNAAMPHEELYAILNSWLRKHEMLSEATGKIAAVDGRRLTIKADGKLTPFTLPANIPVFRRLGDRYEEYASVPVMIGDRAVINRDARNAVVALIVNANYDGATFDRTSSFANWTRSYRADELVKSINNRYPIQQLVDLRPITIDASQRIAEMEFTAEGGRKFNVKGLPIRWSLNVPDNLFVFDKTKDADGMDRYTFYGKGWGHGIGMCQVGAYGMAFRGWKYDQILKRYYTGIEIGAMRP